MQVLSVKVLLLFMRPIKYYILNSCCPPPPSEKGYKEEVMNGSAKGVWANLCLDLCPMEPH